MSNEIYHPNSDGKFEFQFDKSIGENYSNKSEDAYQFALKKFTKFKETFDVNNEPCVFEADIDTFIAILAGVLREYETFQS